METVIVMPVLLLLIFGLIQFAHIWTARQMVTYAAFCATRAIMVVPPSEQSDAANKAAEVALSWITLGGTNESPVTVSGWGGVLGSGSVRDRLTVTNLHNGASSEIAAVRVSFKFPLVISGMAVNKIVAWAMQVAQPPQLSGDFYSDLNAAAGTPTEIDGWPYIELSETCVLPMPYATGNFPTGAFDDVDPFGGGEL